MPAVAPRPVGSGGTTGATGVALASFEAPLVPAELTALTVKKYAVPFVRPVFVYDVVVIPVATPVVLSPPAVVPR